MKSDEYPTTPASIEVVAAWLDSNEINFFLTPEGDTIQFFFDLKEVNLCVGCLESEGLFFVIVVFPVKSSIEKRDVVGEYIDGLRQGIIDSPVEVGYSFDDGEVRLRVKADLSIDTLNHDFFNLMLRKVFFYADKIFPNLNCVMTGAMKPDFALDQTMAAFK